MWTNLTTEQEWEKIIERSSEVPQVVYKHSTRCNISSMVKNRLDKKPLPPGAEFHYLDLIRYRAVSNRIATDMDVWHESPQILIIKNGKCVYDESHVAISMEDIEAEVM